MDPLPVEIRNQLGVAIKAARRAGEAGARKALDVLAVGAARAHASMPPADQDLRRRLRAHGRQLGDRRDPDTGAQQIDRLAHEVAYGHWHRMLFARFLAENDLLIEPESRVAVSLAECEELARDQGEDRWTLAGRFAERMLPRIFRGDDPALTVRLAPETRQAQERLLDSLPAAVFSARDSLGWTYQFWQAERKDAVNKSGVKIGAEELPAVTQLFTERYMVLFLLHNTIGAWRAARILAAQPELAATAVSEDELRRAVRLQANGGYDFAYLRFVRESQEGDEAERPTGRWWLAAGSFAGWPRAAAELRVLDPCCGSGHFLVECLDLLVRLRMEEGRLAPSAAVDAVLRDNLFGLEVDPRCTQIAAFNLALAAWTWSGAGGHRSLPALNLACSGAAPNATRDEWTRLADEAAGAGGLPPKRDLVGVEDTLLSAPLRNSLGALHDLFVKAPVLGSLIDPRALQADLYQHDYESVRVLLGALLEKEGTTHEQTEQAVAAQGMARAAELLAGRYHLVITNVPYLARGKQADVAEAVRAGPAPGGEGRSGHPVRRRAASIGSTGTASRRVVAPQNWLFLTSYRKLREKLLKQRTWNLIARLGPGAFETIGGHVVNVALNVLSAGRPSRNWRMAGIDVSSPRGQQPIRAEEKAALLRGDCNAAVVNAEVDASRGSIHVSLQRKQVANPDAMLSFSSGAGHELLSKVALAYQGISTGDNPAAVFTHWELPFIGDDWVPLQGAPDDRSQFSGRAHLLRQDVLDPDTTTATVRGQKAWRRDGVAVSRIGRLVPARYTGEYFSNVIPVVVPHDQIHLSAVCCFCESGELEKALRTSNSSVSVDNGYFGKIPFDLAYWREVAADKYPNGLPEPYSDDPTQWIFHGHPVGSVVWHDEAKRASHGPHRTDATVLQVAVTRLLGYRWPAERDPGMRLADDARAWVDRCNDLAVFADADGIVCLSSISGDPAAADRLRQLLAAAYGDSWSAATERQLLAAAGSGRPAESIETWLRDGFFEQHCQLFHQRPFIWHVWDGRRDGFHALVNYHRLAGPNGEGRRTLEALTYRHLGDWIARQEAARDQDVDGADGRLAAAHDLRNQLVRIMAGEPPCDLFVRWKPVGEQPIGWEPDINDGVRINIRPFMSAELTGGGRAGAGVLRVRPKIAWNKDRGKEALKPRKRWKPPLVDGDDDQNTEGDEDMELRPREHYPWFWDCPWRRHTGRADQFPRRPRLRRQPLERSALHERGEACRASNARGCGGRRTFRLPHQPHIYSRPNRSLRWSTRSDQAAPATSSTICGRLGGAWRCFRRQRTSLVSASRAFHRRRFRAIRRLRPVTP